MIFRLWLSGKVDVLLVIRMMLMFWCGLLLLSDVLGLFYSPLACWVMFNTSLVMFCIVGFV